MLLSLTGPNPRWSSLLKHKCATGPQQVKTFKSCLPYVIPVTKNLTGIKVGFLVTQYTNLYSNTTDGNSPTKMNALIQITWGILSAQYMNGFCRIFIDDIVTTWYQLIFPWTKLLMLCRRHFQMHFYEWTLHIMIPSSLTFVPEGPIDIIPLSI